MAIKNTNDVVVDFVNYNPFKDSKWLLDKCVDDKARLNLVNELIESHKSVLWISKGDIMFLYDKVFNVFNHDSVFDDTFCFHFTKLLFYKLGIDIFPKDHDGSVKFKKLLDGNLNSSDSRGVLGGASDLAKSFSSSLESDFLEKEYSNWLKNKNFKGDK